MNRADHNALSFEADIRLHQDLPSRGGPR